MTSVTRTTDRTEPQFRALVTLLLGFALPATAFALIAVEIHEANGSGWDEVLVPSWTHVRAWWADFSMTVASVVGGGRGLLAVASVAIGGLLLRNRYADAIFVALAINGAAVLGRAFKNTITPARRTVGDDP